MRTWPAGLVEPHPIPRPLLCRSRPQNSPACSQGWICDVRDVARAHILAAENPSSQGRYIISHPWTISTAAQLKAAQKALPHLEVPAGEEGEVKQMFEAELKASALRRCMAPSFASCCLVLLSTCGQAPGAGAAHPFCARSLAPPPPSYCELACR